MDGLVGGWKNRHVDKYREKYSLSSVAMWVNLEEMKLKKKKQAEHRNTNYYGHLTYM